MWSYDRPITHGISPYGMDLFMVVHSFSIAIDANDGYGILESNICLAMGPLCKKNIPNTI